MVVKEPYTCWIVKSSSIEEDPKVDYKEAITNNIHLWQMQVSVIA